MYRLLVLGYKEVRAYELEFDSYELAISKKEYFDSKNINCVLVTKEQ